MKEHIDNTKSDFIQAKESILRAFTTTDQARIHWSPSPSARTPLQQVAHAAAAIGHITATLDGSPFATPTSDEADLGFRQWEQGLTDPEAVLRLLDENAAAFLAWLDRATPEQVESSVTLPFGLGVAPARMLMAAPAAHTRFHAAQIEYIQTIYGDRDWHLADGR